MPDKKNKVIIAFVPVLHDGYMRFFEKFKNASLYLVDPKDLKNEEFNYIKKDIRQINPKKMVKPLLATGIFKEVKILNFSDIKLLDNKNNLVIMPDDDIGNYLKTKFKNSHIKMHGVFLRWDRRNVEGINIDSDDQISNDDYDLDKMNEAVKSSYKSVDIWRRVGATLVLPIGKVFTAFNNGEPTNISPIMLGDPRNIFNRGVAIEMSSFSHAEATLIAESAKMGISTEGGSLYVTDYPCPACAKLIARSGIKSVFYKDGYALLDGKMIFDEYGVKIRKVIMSDSKDPHPEIWVPYKKS
jgi:dCMP deaminase